MPKSMVNNLDEKFIKFKYPDSWKFTLINEEDRYKPKDMQEKPKEITVKEFADIFKSYETSDLDDLLLDDEIEHHSKRIARSIRVLKLELQLMQEIEDLPSEIDDLINELDLNDLDLLTENINLAKENRFNEKKE